MKQTLSIAFIALLIIIGTSDYYATPNGSGVDCSIIQPCNLDTAMSKAQAGDTIRLSGVFPPTEIKASGLTFVGGVFDGANSTADTLLLISGNDVTIKDTEVKNGYNFGIRVKGYNVTIENSNIHNNIRKYWDGAKCTGAGGWGAGVRVGNTHDVTVQGNNVWQNCGEGIGILASSNVTVKDNQVTNNYSINIYMDETTDTPITGNVTTCNDSRYYRSGQPARGISFGIEGYGTTGKIIRATMTGNTINACRGVYLYLQSGGRMEDSIISYNVFNGASPAVNISASFNVQIIGNVGTGFTAPGATLQVNYTPTRTGIATQTKSVTVTQSPVLTPTGTATLIPTAVFTPTQTPVLVPSGTAVPTLECYIVDTSAGRIQVCLLR